MRLKILVFLICVVALCVGVTSAQDDDVSDIMTLTVDGVERSYHLHLPEVYDSGQPVPLVIALHRFAESGISMAMTTGLNDAADTYGYAVVYPNSLGNFFNDGRIEAGLGLDEGEKDDLTFLMTLLDTLQGDYDFDEVYVTGMDNGGGMALRLVCEHSDRFAGMVIVNALMWDYHIDACLDSEATTVDMLLIQGAENIDYPVSGRVLETADERNDYVIHNAQITANYWSRWSGCDPDDAETINDPLALIISAPCAEGTTVGYYMIEGGGHTWFRTGDYTLNQVGIDATDLLSRFITGDEWTTLPDAEAVSTTIPRTWRTYVPTDYDPNTPTPIVIALHGRPGSGAGMSLITGMNTTAQENGFIVVYPDGGNAFMPTDSGREWNYVLGIPFFDSPDDTNDTDFLVAMVDDITQDLNIDRNRVYMTGFSNGGFMTHRLACEAQDTFAAFAPIGSALFPGLETLCEDLNVEPVPILMMHGTLDVSIPWGGLRSQGPGGEPVLTTSPVQYAVGSWAVRNGCDVDNPETTTLPAEGVTTVHIVDFNACDPGGETIFYMIEGGGHNWPGRPGVIGDSIAGEVNMDINASDVIWDFFSQYTLDE